MTRRIKKILSYVFFCALLFLASLSSCGQNEDESICEHVFSQWIPEVSPTCEKDGYAGYKECTKCHLLFDQNNQEISDTTLKKTSHQFGALHKEIQPTCTENGVKAYKECQQCKKYFDLAGNELYDIVLLKTGHTFTPFHDEIPATCTETGTMGYKTCLTCKKNFDKNDVEIFSLILKAKDHDFTLWQDMVLPTCISEGTLGYKTCKNCGCFFDEQNIEIQDLTIEMLPHSFDDWHEEIPATCTTDGVAKYRTCSVCHRYFGEDGVWLDTILLQKTGHNFSIWHEEIPAKCQEDGTLGYMECLYCHLTFDANKNEIKNLSIAATGHLFTSWVEEVPATSDKDGVRGHKKCTLCQQYFDKEGNIIPDIVILKTNHTFGAWVNEIPATCVANGQKGYKECLDCHKKFNANNGEILDIVIKALGHTYGAWHNEVPAGCETTGTMGYQECTRCHLLFDKSSNELKNIQIAALGHSYRAWQNEIPPTCTTSGQKGYKECSRCHKTFDKENHVLDTLVLEPLGHSYSAFMDEVPPTCTTNGTKGHKTCTTCLKYFDNLQQEIETLDLPATGHTYIENVKDTFLYSEASSDFVALYYMSCKDCGTKCEKLFPYDSSFDGYMLAIMQNEGAVINGKLSLSDSIPGLLITGEFFADASVSMTSPCINLHIKIEGSDNSFVSLFIRDEEVTIVIGENTVLSMPIQKIDEHLGNILQIISDLCSIWGIDTSLFTEDFSMESLMDTGIFQQFFALLEFQIKDDQRMLIRYKLKENYESVQCSNTACVLTLPYGKIEITAGTHIDEVVPEHTTDTDAKAVELENALQKMAKFLSRDNYILTFEIPSTHLSLSSGKPLYGTLKIHRSETGISFALTLEFHMQDNSSVYLTILMTEDHFYFTMSRYASTEASTQYNPLSLSFPLEQAGVSLKRIYTLFSDTISSTSADSQFLSTLLDRLPGFIESILQNQEKQNHAPVNNGTGFFHLDDDGRLGTAFLQNIASPIKDGETFDLNITLESCDEDVEILAQPLRYIELKDPFKLLYSLLSMLRIGRNEGEPIPDAYHFNGEIHLATTNDLLSISPSIAISFDLRNLVMTLKVQYKSAIGVTNGKVESYLTFDFLNDRVFIKRIELETLKGLIYRSCNIVTYRAMTLEDFSNSLITQLVYVLNLSDTAKKALKESLDNEKEKFMTLATDASDKSDFGTLITSISETIRAFKMHINLKDFLDSVKDTTIEIIKNTNDDIMELYVDVEFKLYHIECDLIYENMVTPGKYALSFSDYREKLEQREGYDIVFKSGVILNETKNLADVVKYVEK